MFSFLKHYYPVFVQGTAQTILISIIGILIGIILGLFFVTLRRSKVKLCQYIARVYIAIVRGTPSMIQVMLIYYGLSKVLDIPQIQFLGSGLDRMIPGSIALGINSGAYTAEIFRSGLISIPRGQTEAGLSLGLSDHTTLFSIVMPQAVRNILPALGNEFITLIKESSVLFYIGVQEVTAQALGVGGTLYNFIPPLLVAAIIYFVLTFSMSQVISLLERRLGTAYLKVNQEE
ncbi:amino acid ABC transporter permease [Lentilactobacillus farraginis]|uniref:ABC-type amino acid transport system, permease and periplasmic component n=1 Tax=Lentilactobacillus farraginis DSM 18382 = JCM 14108 TaxID=1423743 RepID=X0PBX7_9LACO|nr:amino acid ABC transporter permease [Lentilactobacillus farraginis]KRM05838.1 arginine ABC transporter, permease protein ArtQ [Lentilactobacillus farraginis DSM 18382 = JCM 14108]GAF37583.1 ABC-type amino acid transport system, permease and periplasmic component [Lentilactobacillus farraginis DSM 18382 = JCM 14108]